MTILRDWRIWLLGGAAAGLVLSPAVNVGSLAAIGPLALGVGAFLALVLAGIGSRYRRTARLAVIFVLATAGGLVGGAERLEAIDDGALAGPPGGRIAVEGFVEAVPRRSQGTVRVRVESDRGRLLLEAPEPVAELSPGERVRARGELAAPPPWYTSTLRRQGIRRILRTAAIETIPGRRSGMTGTLDQVRERAVDALGEGMPDREAALARGFVLGQDDRIDPVTAERFRRSGLSHLLAVSGQNVLLLVLLASPLLGLVGVPLRSRLVCLLALIAVYVPLAGAGASIQRAGVMGAAALVALMAGRPASRAYALVAAAAVTLALNPRATGDVGWQLSFAAVIGIFLLAAPLRTVVSARLGDGRLSRALAEGVAVTVAATLATAPLTAHHFSALSVSSLLANLLALPAVAPAMWIGMIVAGLGQVPGIPVGPLNAVNALLLGYIAEVATRLGDPSWAQLSISLGSPWMTGVTFALLLGGVIIALRFAERRALLTRSVEPSGRRLIRAVFIGLPALAAAAILIPSTSGIGWFGAESGADSDGLTVRMVDVGQGDAVLLQPPDALPILIDAGPPGAGLGQTLRDLGVNRLAAVAVTHDQSDHAGGLAEVLGAAEVDRLLFARAGPHLLGTAKAAGASPVRVAEGSEIRSGSLSLEVLWPPRELLTTPIGLGDDPNMHSLVMLARWGSFEMLFTGDAEAEAVPLDPGPIDVLKVAHHGSADGGLADLLAHSAPALALISVGSENSYGHPAPETLATLDAHDVDLLRTDRDDTISLNVSGDSVDVGLSD